MMPRKSSRVPRNLADESIALANLSRYRGETGEITIKMTAVFMAVPEGYIGFVEELPGANTQGETLDETRENLVEAVQLVLAANRELAERSIVGKVVSRESFDLPL